MNYNSLYSEFIKLFPDDTALFNELSLQSNVDENDGMHIMFSYVVIPFVLRLIRSNDHMKLKIAFDYFEQMALSQSNDITEVLEFTIIENLMSNGKDIFYNAKKYMGKETLKYCTNAEKYLNIS